MNALSRFLTALVSGALTLSTSFAALADEAPSAAKAAPGAEFVPAAGFVSGVPRHGADASVASVRSFVQGQADLGVAVLKSLDDLKGKNAMVSAFSIQEALGMTWLGAEKTTAKEMGKALRFTPESHSVLNTLSLKLLSKQAPEVKPGEGGFGSRAMDAQEIAVENEIWAQVGRTWRRSYLEGLAAWYGTKVNELDFFHDPAGSRKTINEKVAETTRNRIKDLIPDGGITMDTRLVLTNAIYLKTPWADPFDKKATENGTFRMSFFNRVRTPFVKQLAVQRYAEGKGWKAVEKTFRRAEGDRGQLSMVFILPDEGTFEDFEKGLSGERLVEIVRALSSRMETVRLELPKFKFTSPSMSLKDAMQALGMKRAFGNSAEFGGMCGKQDLYVGNIYHKTFIALEEGGVEAAAATAVVMMKKKSLRQPLSEPKIYEFIADRPFFFAIRDTETGAFLFFGRVMDPTKGD